jgi:hypothetical protein
MIQVVIPSPYLFVIDNSVGGRIMLRLSMWYYVMRLMRSIQIYHHVKMMHEIQRMISFWKRMIGGRLGHELFFVCRIMIF